MRSPTLATHNESLIPLCRIWSNAVVLKLRHRCTGSCCRKAGVEGTGCKIYSGIDIDIPVGMTDAASKDRRERREALVGINNDATKGDDLTACTRASVRA